MKYVLIDDITSKASICDETLLLDKTAAQAKKSAQIMWEHLSKKDQNRRDGFYLLKLKDADYKRIQEGDGNWYGDLGVEIWRAK